MKRILRALAILTVLVVAVMAVSSTTSAQGKHGGNGRSNQTSHQRDWQTERARGRRAFGRSHKKYAHGYRNYGQYRRTQVGNRRSHLVRRYYMRDGVRLSRWVRINY